MRDIKFRAWDLDYKVMDKSFFISSCGIAHETPSRTYDTPNTEIEENPNLVLMQFTGLQDMNGVDIYEGDIVSILFTDWVSQPKNEERSLDEYLESLAKVFPVCFHKGAFQISGKGYYGNDIGYDDIECGKHGYIKVIGNIHENSELLP